MNTLFEDERASLNDALKRTADSLRAYGALHRHWRVAFSGGKDSSATVTAVSWLIESGQVPRPSSLGVIYADTRLELPNLQAAAVDMLGVLRSRGWRTEVVLPKLDKRWYVMMLGRGVPPSHSGFRWCTGALKVDPMGEAMRQAREETGEKLLLITGMRVGESANRDRRISLSCGKNGGECGQGWYEESTPSEVANVLSPLLHWRTCHVWDWLMAHQREHGFDCHQVAEVYDQDAEGSALEVLARTGCLVCPVASRDHALERTVRKPEWAYLAPLLELRGLYEELSSPRSRIRKIGERLASGELSANPNRLGPLTMTSREAALSMVLDIQRRINCVAYRDGRPTVDLINGEEFTRIQELIEANTWPVGWTGDEVPGTTEAPEWRTDGLIQESMFGE